MSNPITVKFKLICLEIRFGIWWYLIPESQLRPNSFFKRRKVVLAYSDILNAFLPPPRFCYFDFNNFSVLLTYTKKVTGYQLHRVKQILRLISPTKTPQKWQQQLNLWISIRPRSAFCSIFNDFISVDLGLIAPAELSHGFADIKKKGFLLSRIISGRDKTFVQLGKLPSLIPNLRSLEVPSI